MLHFSKPGCLLTRLQGPATPRPLTRRLYHQFYYILSCTPSCSSDMLVLVLRFVKLCGILDSANASEEHTPPSSG